jgi:hypothetical protein
MFPVIYFESDITYMCPEYDEYISVLRKCSFAISKSIHIIVCAPAVASQLAFPMQCVFNSHTVMLML